MEKNKTTLKKRPMKQSSLLAVDGSCFLSERSALTVTSSPPFLGGGYYDCHRAHFLPLVPYSVMSMHHG
jgi:hypothetical protein